NKRTRFLNPGGVTLLPGAIGKVFARSTNCVIWRRQVVSRSDAVKHLQPRLHSGRLVAALSLIALGAAVPLAGHAAGPDWAATYAGGSALLNAPCLDGTIALSVEENRLGATLADNSNPAVLQSSSFARQMIEGAGFENFGPSLVNTLCRQRSLGEAQH